MGLTNYGFNRIKKNHAKKDIHTKRDRLLFFKIQILSFYFYMNVKFYI